MAIMKAKSGKNPKNVNFSATVKILYRLLQAIHHSAMLCCNELPPALKHKSEELQRFWKPAGISNEFKVSIQDITALYLGNAVKCLKDHYSRMIEDSIVKLTNHPLNREEFNKATAIAASWGRKNLGKKLSKDSLDKFNKMVEGIRGKSNEPQNSQVRTLSPENFDGPSQNTRGTPTRKITPELSFSTVVKTRPPVTSGKRRREDSPPKNTTSPSHQVTKKIRNTALPIRCPKPFKLPEINQPTLFLGDSNLSRITEIPGSKIQVLSFPGAKFYNIRTLLETMSECNKTVKKLVISLGINERYNNISLSCIPQFERLITTAKEKFPQAKIFCTEIQYNQGKLGAGICSNLVELNNGMKISKNVNFITGLKSKDIEIDPNDKKYKIHWTTTCANATMKKWVQSLN